MRSEAQKDTAGRLGVTPGMQLVLPMHKRMVVQAGEQAGVEVLNVYYDDKHISFDDPRFFAFGRRLAESPRFEAGEAMQWGDGYDWAEVAPLLGDLCDAGILKQGDETAVKGPRRRAASPLPPASAQRACTWSEIGEITQRLGGRAVDPAHLELVVPMFRVAHIWLDADGRQVGEANVFPRALRQDIPTEWTTCPYPGTRHQSDRPMNTTALKAMRAHWGQMMTSLARIRDAYLVRYPQAATAPTIADVERLSALVLAVPTYQLVRLDSPVENGALHPALSSLIRVTDGLRMATHQMMFVPVGEEPVSPDAPASVDSILDYVERNYSLHSETGVCAGPANLIREFLSVVVDGAPVEGVQLDPQVEAALADMQPAFDYGLRAMRAHCALFTFYPAMAATYEELDALLMNSSASREVVEAFAKRADIVRRRTLLARDRWRSDRVQTYHRLFDGCGAGLAGNSPSLAEMLAASQGDGGAGAVEHLVLAGRVDRATALRIAPPIVSFAARAHAILRAAAQAQGEVNDMLGRMPPAVPFAIDDLDVHGHLLGDVPQRLPMLTEELEHSLGIVVEIDAGGFTISRSKPGTEIGESVADKSP